MPEENGKQHPKSCSYGYKLLCADDKFSKTFKTLLGKYTVYKFINNVIKERKYCSEMIKKI